MGEKKKRRRRETRQNRKAQKRLKDEYGRQTEERGKRRPRRET